MVSEPGGETQLDQAVILIAACKAIVTNDSGLMHVAAALNRPLVAPVWSGVARTSHHRYPIKHA